jgi:hypothetical protein
MGQNNAGTTFWGPNDRVFTDNAEVIRAMNEHGPGIILDGSHGTPEGEMQLEPTFTIGTRAFFNNPSKPYAGQVTVLDITELTSEILTDLGGPGQNAYVNWCWGGFCKLVLGNLTQPLEP